MIRLLYFARLREQLDTPGEEIAPTADLATVGDILALLRRRGGVWSERLAEEAPVLAAVNQETARPETPVVDGDEVAFFPPVTGG
ncbi:MAG: molybdopterin converting factor subunit 1 [Candidatus Thiosymbion ectosymbiont of Robbea hypermnestra]|nr:molybdopterin converting factor subunit 1 [Candidatus Thiosymbion ectosymbiont of Robbea hypermnestra]